MSNHQQPTTNNQKTKKGIFSLIMVLLLSVIPRLYFLFFVVDPQNAGAGWYGDTYHHWQIAYLSLTTGFKQGFLRLWDLKGMEYFWGLLHPLILSGLMFISGSADIIITRLLSIICGSLTVGFIYLLAKRYWNAQAAWGAVVLAALNPVGIFNDASGMVEPLAAVFLLGGIYFWPKKPALTAFMWALSAMARGEAWLFTVGLILGIVIFEKKKFDQKAILLAIFALANGLYMKYLLDKTGNPIYPIWWSFLGNAWGKWQAKIPLRPDQQLVQPIFIAMFIVSLILIMVVALKRPRGWLLYLLGLGNVFFLGGFVGLTQYMKSYVHYFWVVRIFVLPYIILGVAVSALLLYYLPKLHKFKTLSHLLGWLMIVIILLASQGGWLAIWHYFQPTINIWAKEVEASKQTASWYTGGRILIPENDPQFTYCLVRYGGIKGEAIIGQMFDPFYYWPKDVFNRWPDYRDKMIDWLKDNEIRILVIGSQGERYQKLIELEPQLFKSRQRNNNFNLEIYEVQI